jgi:hypothetical protein
VPVQLVWFHRQSAWLRHLMPADAEGRRWLDTSERENRARAAHPVCCIYAGFGKSLAGEPEIAAFGLIVGHILRRESVPVSATRSSLTGKHTVTASREALPPPRRISELHSPTASVCG